MLKWWQRISIERPKLVLILSSVAIVGLGVYGTGLFNELSSSSNMNSDTTEAARTATVIEEAFGATPSGEILLFEPKNNALSRVTDPNYQTQLTEILAPLQDNGAQITSYQNTGSESFISNDGTKTYALITINDSNKEILSVLTRAKKSASNSDLAVSIGGETAINDQTNATVSSELALIELISLPILLILLLFFFKSAVAAAVPIGIALATIIGALAIVRLLNTAISIDTYAINVITILGIGLAIDYALLCVNRFKEELPHGVAVAVQTMIATSGRTIIFSGITVIACLLALLVFPIEIMRSIAIGGTSAVAMAVIVTLVMLPASLALIGPRINKLSISSIIPQRLSPNGGVWKKIAMFVTSRPIVSLAGGTVVVLLTLIPLSQFKPGTMDYNWIARGNESHNVAQVLATEFPASTTDITLALQLPSNTTPEERILLSCDITHKLKALNNISNVSSGTPSNSLNECTNTHLALVSAPQNANPLQQLQTQFISESALQFAIDITSANNTTEAYATLKEVRNITPVTGSLFAGGQVATAYDNNQLYINAIPYAIAIIVVAMIVLLSLALRSVVVPLQAIVTNAVGLLLSTAAIVGVFQLGWFSNFTGWPQVDGLALAAPILVIAIAFGLAMDYSVFLYARMRETYDKTNDPIAAIREGIIKTGPIITAAALALFVVVVGFMFSSVVFMQIIGLGLAVAVIVDAFFVRLILVPSIMTLMGKKSWYGPKFLDRFAIRHD
ncbi:MMPL family transporter [Candidatus Saccharibacteria bacterium]|nr:MMPL family transporter [Candidatus Saccharibacteria bacterium]